jgi:putative FmdB family regulatory protein
MPIYEYRCAACGHYLDALQKMTDAPLRKCPDCGKSQLRRLVSAPQFRLKGSGWYETDFKKGNETKRNLVENAAADSKDGGGDKAADAPAKKDDGAKLAAETKKDGEAKPARSKPVSVKPSPSTRRKAAAKSGTNAARR